MIKDIWKEYAEVFNAMSDEEVELDRQWTQDMVDVHQQWLDAVASWVAAGKPRDSE